MNTIQLLDAIRERRNLPSDYATAAALGLTRAQISRYRQGKEAMGDEVAQRAAALLGLDPAVVVAQMHAQRASDPQTRSLWIGIADRLERASSVAAVVLIALMGVTFTGGPDGGAFAADRPTSHQIATTSVYYVNLQTRRTSRH